MISIYLYEVMYQKQASQNLIYYYITSNIHIIHFQNMISFYILQPVNQQQQPSPRWGQSMVCIQNQIFLFGGYENSKYYNDLWKFNLDNLCFQKIEQQGDIPPPCSNFTLNYHPSSNNLLLFGGGTLNKEKLNSVYKLNISSYTWQKLSFPENITLPWQRSYHCAEIIGDFLVICGGEFFHDLDDTWILNLNTNEWKQIKPNAGGMKPKGRKFASSFVYDNKLYVVGGCSGKYECLDESLCMDFSQFLESGDSKLLQWKQVQFQGRELMVRWGHISIVQCGKAYIFGGRLNNKDLQTLIEVDLKTKKCKSINFKGESPKGRRRPGMCIRNNSLFCFSGFDGSYIKDFICFNLPLSLEENKINEDTQGRQRLEKYLTPNNIEEQCINFEDDVLYVTQDQFEQIQNFLCYYKSEQDVYFSDTNYIISANKLTKSSFFTHLLNTTYSQEEFLFYSPVQLPNEEKQILYKMFLSYFQFGKVIVPRSYFAQSKFYFKYLLHIAEYYCCNELQQICKKELLKFFSDELVSQKANIDAMLYIGETLSFISKKYENYAGYYILNKLVDKHRQQIKCLSDLKLTIKRGSFKNMDWLLMMASKYSFELSQMIMLKKEVDLQNINNENIPHKEEILYEKTRKGSMHNRHINV